MKSLFPVFLAVLAVTAGAASGATLAGDYRLQDTYNSSAGSIGLLTVVGSANGAFFTSAVVDGVSQRALRLGADTGGTSQITAGIQTQTNPFLNSANYSLVLLASVSLDPNLVATKILDFKNLSSDAGLYINDTTGLLSFNGDPAGTPPGGTPVPADTFVQIVLTRDGTTGQVSVYQEGALALQFDDTMNLAVLGDAGGGANSFLTVFKDDGAGAGSTLVDENTAGTVNRLRLYDGVLSPLEVAGLDRASVPEPGTYALFAAGAVALLAGRRLRVGAYRAG